jgi:hypothetical protein
MGWRLLDIKDMKERLLKQAGPMHKYCARQNPGTGKATMATFYGLPARI